MDLGVLDNWK